MKQLLLTLVLLAGLVGAPGAGAGPLPPHQNHVYLPIFHVNREGGVTIHACGEGDQAMTELYWEIITPDGKGYNLTANGLGVRGAQGLGFPPLTHVSRTLPLQHGGLLDSIWAQPRTVTITEAIGGDCPWALADLAQRLMQCVRFDRTACVTDPLTLRRHLDGVVRDLHAILGDYVEETDENGEVHITGIRLVAYDPFFFDPAEQEVWAQSTQSFTVRTIVGKIGGAWNAMGPPHAAGIYNSVLAFAEDDTYLYIGGNFTNWDNVPNADMLVRRNKATGVYSALNATPLNAQVYALAVAPNGTLLVGGLFTDAGGFLDADYLCTYDPVTGLFGALNGTPLDARVYAIATAPTGVTYVGGDFTDAGGHLDADYLMQFTLTPANEGDFDAVNATPLGAGSSVLDLACAPNGDLFIGGNFTDAGGDLNADYVCRYDHITDAFGSLSTVALNDLVSALAIGSNGILYIGGRFTNAGGYANGSYVCKYNGVEFLPLGDGVNDRVNSMRFSDDGMLYIGGSFTVVGGVIADRAARWNGSIWMPLSLDLPGAALVTAIYESDDGDLYIGFDTAGYAVAAYPNTITTTGSVETFPIVEIVTGPGTLQTIENASSDAEVPCNMFIQDGEGVTFDFSPGAKSVESDWGGSRLADVYPASDIATFSLVPDPRADDGNNLVNVFISGQPVEAGDNNNQLAGWENVSGLTDENTDDGRLWVSIVAGWRVNLYSDSAKAAGDMVAHTGNYAGTGLQALVADNASGVGGSILITAVVGGDTDITVDFALVRFRFYNRYWTLADALAP